MKLLCMNFSPGMSLIFFLFLSNSCSRTPHSVLVS